MPAQACAVELPLLDGGDIRLRLASRGGFYIIFWRIESGSILKRR